MSEKANETHQKAEKALDLSSLHSLSLGPNWGSAEGKRKEPHHFRDYDPAKKDKAFRKGRGKRDRRGSRHSREGERHSDNAHGESREPFKPCVDVSFYPEDAPFKVLTQAVRTSYRTYELFEIARLILQKLDRFVVVVRPLPLKERPLFVSVQDNLPFMSEDDAINHALSKYIDHFFDREIVNVEPPKGNFTQVNRCSLSGVLLGPPNYHRYQDLLQAHYNQRFAHMPFDRFLSKVEAVKDDALIGEWIESMKTETHYILKPKAGEEAQTFDSFERARFYMVTHRKDELVRSTLSARFSGRALELYSGRNEIKRSVEFILERQRRFPLDTANHLRGRLRRMNFSVYKKGSKGISYVCGVKRRFRNPEQHFSESVQLLIDFIDAHPMVLASTLPEVYLGLSQGSNENASAKGDEVAEESPVVDEPIAAENEKALKQLSIDLRWLVSEGYVIEYSDGRLLAMPVKEDPKAKEEPNPAKSDDMCVKEDDGVASAATDASDEKNDTQTAERMLPQRNSLKDGELTDGKTEIEPVVSVDSVLAEENEIDSAASESVKVESDQDSEEVFEKDPES